MTERMLGPCWSERQGYTTCSCGRVTCRKRRASERRRMRRIEAQNWRKEAARHPDGGRNTSTQVKAILTCVSV